ncbi:hypothetical protein BTO14_12450 [Polaribacter butkevichii]|uniref:Uncharacterized protein n=1 Tax=Polaribacter butkevichii TaxID=218490 RepID=A0A2P6C7F7_9FLAO|nr:hypothetical protein BTO14_12450 [Polaribacter butkevichii]
MDGNKNLDITIIHKFGLIFRSYINFISKEYFLIESVLLVFSVDEKIGGKRVLKLKFYGFTPKEPIKT